MNGSLGFICCVWDDPRGVMRHLDNPDILMFDYICFFDGKFTQWEGKPEFPVNEVRDVVKDWSQSTGIQAYYENIVDKTEASKRNHCLFRANQIGMKWGLIVDADEIITLDRIEFDIESYLMDRGECHAVMVDNYNIPQRKPRLLDIKCRPYYKDNDHSKIYSGDTGKTISENITATDYTVESITIKHNKEFYSEYRFDQRNIYGATKH